MSLEETVGQTLVFGIPGTTVRPQDIRLFKDTHAGGLILHASNFKSPQQIKRLISDLESALKRKLLVTIDHEGGRVTMFPEGLTIFPDNLALGTITNTENASQQGAIEAQELRRLGIDVNFSPTVDVLTDTHSPNIGIRSYGKDPVLVSAMSSARIKTMQKNGISACAKHFPGLGPADKDPHIDLPVIPITWDDLRKTHILPFISAMKAGIDMIMSSHPLYPHLDPTPKTPATFSQKIIKKLLREELCFQGVIASDDLEMGALKNICPIEESVVRAAKAGHDLLLVCHKPDLQRRAYKALLKAYQSKKLLMDELDKSVFRINRLKSKRQHRFLPGAPEPHPQHTQFALTLAHRSVTVSSHACPLPLNPKTPAHIVFPKLSQLAPKIMIETSLMNEKKFIQNHTPDTLSTQIIPINPKQSDIQKAFIQSQKAHTIIYFCYDAHLNKGCLDMLKKLQNTGKEFILVLLRNPYDEIHAQPQTTTVTAFGFRACQIQACLEHIFGL